MRRVFRTTMWAALAALLSTALVTGACGPPGPEVRTLRRPGEPTTRATPRRPPPPRRLSNRAREAFHKLQRSLRQTLIVARQRGGAWKRTDCARVAGAFARLARDHRAEPQAVARARFNQGVAWSRCGVTVKARWGYEAALRSVASYAPALVNLAALDARAGRPQAALGGLLKAFRAAPGNLDANYNLAVLLQQRAQTSDVAPPPLVRYWRGLKFKPASAFDLAELHLRMVMAKSSAGQGVRSATLNLKAYNLLALLYFQRSKRRGHRSKRMLAKLVLTEARKVLLRREVRGRFCKRPKRPSAFDRAAAGNRNITGLILLTERRLVDAMKRFEGAIQCDAALVEAHLNRAAIALGFRGYWIAHDSFRAVLRRQPKNVDAIIGLGVAFRGIATAPVDKGRPRHPASHWYGRAAAQYKRALAVRATAADALYNLAHLHLDYLNDRVTAGLWFSRYLGLAVKHTSPRGRKFAREQLAEIAYQDSVYCRMIPAKAKRRSCQEKAASRQARWRVIQKGGK